MRFTTTFRTSVVVAVSEQSSIRPSMNPPGDSRFYDFIFQCNTRSLSCIDNSFQRFVFCSRVSNCCETRMNIMLLCQVQHHSLLRSDPTGDTCNTFSVENRGDC